MSETETIESLARRLRALEDRAAIQQLITGYGYAVDSLSAETVGNRWGVDGDYDTGLGYHANREEIMTMVRTDPHQEFVHGGCAHFSSNPYILIEGDKAVATIHHLLLRHGENGFYLFRVSAGRLELSRKPDGGWQIDHRRHRLLDGDPEAWGLLGKLDVGPGYLTRP